ncbi:MAG: cytochrome c [Rhodopila sp.]|nr:cytochrome c [Rhodopila sp.]
MTTQAIPTRNFVAALCLGFTVTLTPPAIAQNRDGADPALVAQGEYIARAGDCVACHTAPGGKPFAGGLPMETPIGTIYSTNITPDPKTGIGGWSYDDFARLMRTGVTKDNGTVYPAMPYPSYARMNDADMKALYAYFMHGVQPVEAENRASDIPWPLSMRWPLTFWRWTFAPNVAAAQRATPAVEDSATADKIARGAYLVEGAGHCGACHTPRGLGMQERALTKADGDLYLSGGGPIDGWLAPSLRNEPDVGLGSWSEDDIVAFLKTGRNSRTATFGAMNDVVVHSMEYLSDPDLHSIAAYLKSLPPRDGNIQPYTYNDTISKALFNGDASVRGAQVYVDRCAACHRTDGKGYNRVFPALAGNPALQSGDPTSAIHIVLSGSRMPATMTAPSAFVMAPYADILTDQSIADVVSFIQTSWGNRGQPATAEQVAAMRKSATPVPAMGQTVVSSETRTTGP